MAKPKKKVEIEVTLTVTFTVEVTAGESGEDEAQEIGEGAADAVRAFLPGATADAADYQVEINPRDEDE